VFGVGLLAELEAGKPMIEGLVSGVKTKTVVVVTAVEQPQGVALGLEAAIASTDVAFAAAKVLLATPVLRRGLPTLEVVRLP
jgi:hypothetical protein